MKSIIVIILLFSSLVVVQAQPHLIAQKNKSRKEKIIPKNKKVKIFVVGNKTYKGKYVFVNDSTLSINGNQVLLTEIVQVRAISMGNRILGSVLMTMGGIVAVPSLLALPGASPWDSTSYLILIGFSGCTAGLGWLVSHNIRKKYKGEKWHFKWN